MKNQSFNELAIHTSKGSHILIAFVGSVGRILSISKGRDKFLGLIQHMSDLYKKCMIDYLSAYRTKEWPVSVKNANSLQQAIKEGRKLLRLFKWIEELGKVGSKIRVKTKFIILLKVFFSLDFDSNLILIAFGVVYKEPSNLLDILISLMYGIPICNILSVIARPVDEIVDILVE